MTGAQPILTYTVLYTYVIFVMLHWYVIGLCGLVVRILDDTDVLGSNPVKSKNKFC